MMSQNTRGYRLTGDGKLIAVDLFSGAGGFTEGFRQAGIEVAVAYEMWEPARLTHEKNHPQTKAIRQDILNLTSEAIRAEVPHIDIVFGSPPCTEFSMSNKGGKGDIAKGLSCVFKFLELVHELRPRYWVMENVPRLERFLNSYFVYEGAVPGIPLSIITGKECEGLFLIPTRHRVNATWCGVPQKRERLFWGDYPAPAQITDASTRPLRLITLGDVLNSLPDPEGEAASFLPVIDPNYSKVVVAATDLTDHFNQDVILDEHEFQKVRHVKQDHSWYGRMALPDDTSQPARTVMARHSRVAREAIYAHTSNGLSIRRLTPREYACVMGFPLVYQFWGDSDRIRLMQIGNAVCPPVAAAIGRSIMTNEQLTPQDPTFPTVEAAPLALVRLRRPQTSADDEAEKNDRPFHRPFRRHLPKLKLTNRRVDIENSFAAIAGSIEPMPRDLPRHPIQINSEVVRHATWWRSVFHVGIGDYTYAEFGWPVAVRDMIVSTWDHADARVAVEAFLRQIADDVPVITPDATTLQATLERRIVLEKGRVELLLERLSDIVRNYFPVDGLGLFRVTTEEIVVAGERQTIALAVLASLVAASFACDCANRSACWITEYAEDFYWTPGIRIGLDFEGMKEKSECLRQEVYEEIERTSRELKEGMRMPTQPALSL